MKLKEQSDQGETSRLVSTLYGRFHRIRCNILKLINELSLRSREPLGPFFFKALEIFFSRLIHFEKK